VHPADLADVSGLVRLTQSVDYSSAMFSGRPLLDSTDDHIAHRFTEIISEGARTLLVAVDEVGAMVGLLVARDDEIGAIDLTPVLHVTHLMVAPKQRRRGVGRLLLTAAVHLADERGMDHILATRRIGIARGQPLSGPPRLRTTGRAPDRSDERAAPRTQDGRGT